MALPCSLKSTLHAGSVGQARRQQRKYGATVAFSFSNQIRVFTSDFTANSPGEAKNAVARLASRHGIVDTALEVLSLTSQQVWKQQTDQPALSPDVASSQHPAAANSIPPEKPKPIFAANPQPIELYDTEDEEPGLAKAPSPLESSRPEQSATIQDDPALSVVHQDIPPRHSAATDAQTSNLAALAPEKYPAPIATPDQTQSSAIITRTAIGSKPEDSAISSSSKRHVESPGPSPVEQLYTFVKSRLIIEYDYTSYKDGYVAQVSFKHPRSSDVLWTPPTLSEHLPSKSAARREAAAHILRQKDRLSGMMHRVEDLSKAQLQNNISSQAKPTSKWHQVAEAVKQNTHISLETRSVANDVTPNRGMCAILTTKEAPSTSYIVESHSGTSKVFFCFPV